MSSELPALLFSGCSMPASGEPSAIARHTRISADCTSYSLLASVTMAYAMANLGWKFYFINGAWHFVFLVIAYCTSVETKGLGLEESTPGLRDLPFSPVLRRTRLP